MTLRKMAKWLAHSYSPGLTGRFTYFGTHVFFPQDAWIFRLACEQGIYESEILTLILGLVRPNTWFFDVGANIGLMSVPVLSQRSDVRVLSFEPSSNSVPYLLKTHQKCPWKDRWVVRSAAAAEKKGKADFSIGPSPLGGYDGLRHTRRAPQTTTNTVEVTTLDDEWLGVGMPQVSFIKLDIEGAEIPALNGAKRVLSECRPYIILEWYAENFAVYGDKSEDLLDFASRSAYEVVAIPTMNVVNSVQLLRALMIRTGAFMLMPIGTYVRPEALALSSPIFSERSLVEQR